LLFAEDGIKILSRTNYKEFIINRAVIIAWLRFLLNHNRYYQDIDIDAAIQRCNDSLPDNGSIAGSLSSIEENDLDQVIESIRNTDSDNMTEDGDDDGVDDEGDGINPRPETGGASGVDTAPSVSNEYLRLPLNPTSAEREQHENLLKEFRGRSDSVTDPARPEHLEWPQEGRILNDLSEPGILSRAFPILFPTVKDRPNEVKMFMAARNFVKYAVNMREAKEHLLSNSSLTEDQKKFQTLFGTKVKINLFIHLYRATVFCTGYRTHVSAIAQLVSDLSGSVKIQIIQICITPCKFLADCWIM